MKFLYALGTMIALPVLLPLTGLLWVFNKAVVPFRKSSQNGMIYLEEAGKRTLFSPFFEFEAPFLDTQLLVKVVVKLGNDGINPAATAPKTARAAVLKKPLFREATLFLINQGAATIEIAPKFLEIDAETITKLDDTPQLIASGHYHECEPVMAQDSRDVRFFDVKVVLAYQGQMHEISGRAPRLSVAELAEKYRQKEPHEA